MSPLAEGVAWAAVAGLCLWIVGLRWGLWLMLPAAIGFLAFPLVYALAQLPFWPRVAVTVVSVVLAPILLIRGSRAILEGVFGDDGAARAIGRWLAAMLGSTGRSRPTRRPSPRLPRQAPPFNPRDLGGSR
jgi:hypothetical protein